MTRGRGDLLISRALRRIGCAPAVLRAKVRDSRIMAARVATWPRWPRLLGGLDEMPGGTGGVWFAVTVRSVPPRR